MRQKIIFFILPLLFLGAACGKTTTTSNDNQQSVNYATQNSNTVVVNTSATCPSPLLQSPVDLTKATSILYPGQTRGGDYKKHGGFRFDNSQTTDITVTIPLHAQLKSMSRYIERGVTQYLMDFTTECGYTFRFDHLLTLTPKFQAIADTLPAAQVDDSRTTNVDPVTVTTGETVAIAVGMSSNAFVDFGMYKTLQNAGPNDLTGVCWFDLLPAADVARIRSLPAADQTAGTTSEYCK